MNKWLIVVDQGVHPVGNVIALRTGKGPVWDNSKVAAVDPGLRATALGCRFHASVMKCHDSRVDSYNEL